MSLPFASLLERDWRPRILLVGDVMLDRYLWGDVERISPEAPIPVLRVGKQEHRLGGAGSVAAMLSALARRPSWRRSSAMMPKAASSASCSTSWRSTTARW